MTSSKHDPLCSYRGVAVVSGERAQPCICHQLAMARDERGEQIAQDIEAKRIERLSMDDDEELPGHDAGMEFAFRISARIARSRHGHA